MDLQKKCGEKIPEIHGCYLYIIIIEYLGWLTFETYTRLCETVCYFMSEIWKPKVSQVFLLSKIVLLFPELGVLFEKSQKSQNFS